MAARQHYHHFLPYQQFNIQFVGALDRWPDESGINPSFFQPFHQ
jgi:hypothetical protein